MKKIDRRKFLGGAAAVAAGSAIPTKSEAAYGRRTTRSEERAVIIGSGFGGGISALRLAQAGVKRGSGESTGVIERPGTLNSEWQIPILATDLAKLADELKAQGFTRVGVTGSSMGGWVSIAAAARTDSVDFVIAINGGASSVALSDAFDVLTDEGASIEEAIVHVQSLALAPSYAPDNDLSRLKQPVLWVLGEQDSSNPTALDVRVIEDWVSRGKDFQTLIVANADHNFLDIETGQPRLEWLAQARTFAVGDD